MEYIESDSTNPFWNLALEDYLLRSGRLPGGGLLVVWSSVASVVLGRFQNPWAEAAVPHLIEDGVFLVRRQSGGGCVFQDDGNINLSFIGRGLLPAREKNLAFVGDFLRLCGFAVSVNNRCDIVLDGGGKISGSAFKQTRDAYLHHLTMLVDGDVERLWKCLSPSLSPRQSRAVGSVRSVVATLRRRNPLFSPDYLMIRFREYLSSKGIVRSSLDIDSAAVGRRSQEFSRWDWTVGGTPKFDYDDGTVAFQSHRGMLTDIRLGDAKVLRPGRALPMDAEAIGRFLQEMGVSDDGDFFAGRIGRTLALNGGLR